MALLPAMAPLALVAAPLIPEPETDTDPSFWERSSSAWSLREEVREPARRAGEAGAGGGGGRRRNAGSLWPLDALVEAEAALLCRWTGELGLAEGGAVSLPYRIWGLPPDPGAGRETG